MNFTKYKIIVFDLDDTLAISKQFLDENMSSLLSELLKIKKVAIISGAGFNQINDQVISKLHFDENIFKNLYLFPTSGGMMYSFNKDWTKVYENILNDEEKMKIKQAFENMYQEIDFLPKITYGEALEDRNTQYTFSALGQKAPIDLKKEWDSDMVKRIKIKECLDKYLPEFEVKIGGTTSIDINKKSIDKGYAIGRIEELLNLKKEEILFIGDAIFQGGNDYSVVKTSVSYIKVDNLDHTKDIIKNIINN